MLCKNKTYVTTIAVFILLLMYNNYGNVTTTHRVTCGYFGLIIFYECIIEWL
jgi:hypothetical protein